MNTKFGATRAGHRAPLLLSYACLLVGTSIASAAPPNGPEPVTAASALAHVAADAQRVSSKSREFEQVRARADEHLQTGTAALKKLEAADPKTIYVTIAAARDEFQVALATFDRLPPLNEVIVAGLSALQTAVDSARARQSTAPFELAQIERAEKLLDGARSVSQSATHFIDSELSIAQGAANSHLAELAALEQAQIDANRNSTHCDIHDVRVESFQYPARVFLWMPNLRLPMFEASNGGYHPHPVLYADLDGNGRMEAIVQLTRGYATAPPVSDCYRRGQGAIVIFEMDEKCVVQRLASIGGNSTDSVRIKRQTLLVDQPYFAPTGASTGECKVSGVVHFAWQLKGGKLRAAN